ncbi:hypothetical protein ScPMuIL_004132 [Solemya velum]
MANRCRIYITTIILLFVYEAIGECLHSGKQYMNHTLWLPEPCTICTCQDPVTVCEPIRCRDPRCNFSKGEYLQISADGCCPECVEHLSPCQYEGRLIPHNTDWQPRACTSCVCLDGKVTCQNVRSPQQRCKPGEISQHLPGQCHSQCIPAGRSCIYDGQRHQDGSEWSPLPCAKCVCRDGQAKCYPIQCGPVSCPQGQSLDQSPDSCCPSCVGDLCTEGQRQYKDGDEWSRDACTPCVCLGGTVVCTQRECPQTIQCQQNERLITKEAECCPECVSDEAACSHEVPLRYSGDIWNISDCEFCVCNHGDVQCHTARCEHRQCNEYEVLRQEDDRCCPECVTPPHCQFGEDTTYQAGDTWHPDPCSVCNCEGGEVVCYQQPCPRCPARSIPVIMPGDCCGECTPVECHDDCATCEPHKPEYCTSCRISEKLVQNGKCVQNCKDGFYPASDGKCKNCHDNCRTCVDESEYHCVACPPGLLWRDGECITHCGPGFYLQNSQCLACYHLCKMCNGPEHNQCLACSNSGHILQRGQCVSKCHGQFYIRSKECKECPPACGSCLVDSPTCANCHPGAFLHEGQCMVGCPVGYFSNQERVCVACHPSCKSCRGPSVRHCAACTAGAELTSQGTCDRPCSPGQYLHPNGDCYGCDPDCASCVGTWDGSDTVCMSCVDSMMWPYRSQCTIECPPGHYLQGGICRECGYGCLECETPSICVQCRLPLMLSDGFCVHQCGHAHYADEDKFECTACAPDCVKCYSATKCSVCNSHTYLREGVCVRRCDQGYYTNEEHRECQANQYPPQLQILSQLQLEEGGRVPLPEDIFYLTDSDTPEEHLRIYVIEPPSNGYLLTVEMGDDRALGREDFFTLSDVRRGKIRFSHSLNRSRKGRVVLKASDRQLFSEDSILFLQAVAKEPLTLETNNVLTATGGDVTALTSDVIQLHSGGGGETVSITVVKGPLHGRLEHRQFGVPVTSFTLQDLESEQIAYYHNRSSQAGRDVILMRASDGYFVLTFLFKVEIRPKDSHVPMLIRNKAAHVMSGGLLQLTSDLLMARSLKEEEDIVYTLVPPVDNPKEGELLMVVAIPASGVGRGWESMGNGNMAAKMFRFYQRDIDEGRIWYKNRKTQQKSDMIQFEVADTSEPPNILRGQEFHITVIEENVQAIAEPTMVPGVRLGMTVFENQLVPLTRAYLAFEDADTSDQNLIYTITTSLAPSEGTLERVDHPFTSLFTFTQDDINNNRIVYRPPDSEIGTEEMVVSFTFIVFDDQNKQPLHENKFTIRVVPVNNMPPVFLNVNPTLTVFQGSSVPLDQSVVALTDPDTAIQNIQMTLVTGPQLGHLAKVSDGLRAVIRRGDRFTYQELVTGVFQYVHEGTDQDLTDIFQLSASDGSHQSVLTINVTVLEVDRSSPYLLPTASCSITVQEGTSVTLTRDHVAFEDEDENDHDELAITLDTEPQHGQLLFGSHQSILKRGHTFTQGDINTGYVSYTADREVGNQPIRDVMSFNVSDSNGNVLPSQAFTALIEPKDNQSPRVHLGPEIEVYEGGQVMLTGDYISGNDPDSSVRQLIVVLEALPHFGVIQDNVPDGGSEVAHVRNVSTFPLQDLLDGHVSYIQSNHRNKEPAWDGFLFHISDGTNVSPTHRFNITILAVNDEPPLIVTEQLFVQENGAVLLTNASLYVIDIDSDDTDLIFTLETPPSYGNLKKKEFFMDPVLRARVLKQGFTFTYEDVLNELMVYEHDGGEITTDSFTLLLTDGDFNDTKVMSVVIGLVNDETPRVAINRGLRVQAGSTMPIKSKDLKATDIDSEDSKIKFTITQNPSAGVLRLNKKGHIFTLLSQGPRKVFKQSDVDRGYLEYVHSTEDMTGNIVFKFTVSDPEGNDLIDQSFHITVLELTDVLLYSIGVPITEFSQSDLAANSVELTDVLLYLIGVPITEFSQSDLAANSVVFVHTSPEEIYTDRFTFMVTDGTNEITQAFYISITPVDDSIPVVQNNGLRVQEGVRKLITEFDLKASRQRHQGEPISFHNSAAPAPWQP